MSYETLIVEQKGAVTLITLNRPQALNALNSTVLAELIAAFAAFEADTSQGCAVLTGSGEKAFAAGADIKEMVEKPGIDFFLEDFFAGWQSGLVRATRKPWIAAVNGFRTGRRLRTGDDGGLSSSRRKTPNSASPRSSSASPPAWAARSA